MLQRDHQAATERCAALEAALQAEQRATASLQQQLQDGPLPRLNIKSQTTTCQPTTALAEAATLQQNTEQHKAAMAALEGRHEGLLREMHLIRQRHAQAEEAARAAGQRAHEVLLTLRGVMGAAQEQLGRGMDAVGQHLRAAAPAHPR